MTISSVLETVVVFSRNETLATELTKEAESMHIRAYEHKKAAEALEHAAGLLLTEVGRLDLKPQEAA